MSAEEFHPVPAPILIVDDDPWNARIVAAVLQAAGYRTLHVGDPRDGLPALRREPISLVLLDQNMPEMDGLSLLERIRKESDVPVVMLTAADRSDLAVRALRLGAYDYLTKPVDERRLLETVPQAIDSRGGGAHRIGRYEVEREVGRGGMGVVYAARDRELGRSVALKVLLPELAADPEYEGSFLAEARSAAQFAHPNIVTVYDAGRYRGRLFIAMELLRGRTLQDVIDKGPALPARKVFELGWQAACALEAVHAAGMIHRDLKPGNVMLTGESTLKILDFGLVRPAHPAGPEAGGAGKSFTGTLSYIPPEVLTKGTTDARGDIYGLGLVLYELLAGVRAFDGGTEFDLMFKIVEGALSKPWSALAEVPPEGLETLRRMMAAKPEERFESMARTKGALQALLG